MPNLIGRKKVDWSIFEYGTQIPFEFHEDFEKANGNRNFDSDERVKIELIINGTSYEANISKNQRNDLVLRYDKNNGLKEVLRDGFQSTYQYIIENRDEKSTTRVQIADDKAEYIDFYQTDKPFVYKVLFQSKNTKINPSFWWVNQGKTHTQEREGEFLWAPQKSKRGFPVPHHISLKQAQINDIVFCYSNKKLRAVGVVTNTVIESPKPSIIASDEWQEEGYLVSLKYFNINPEILKEEIPLEWRKNETGPFDINGDIKQGYFFELSDQFSKNLIAQFRDRLPKEVGYKMETYQPTQEKLFIREELEEYSYKALITHIHTYISTKGFLYTIEEITNLFLSLKTKPFVILSGISGTGKTKMVQWFAESVGANEDNGQFTLIPIRPDWNDGSDLLGYKDIKGDFIEGPLTKVIKRANKHPAKPYFVLLDEMNLARVEYYFSDILSVMESRRWKDGEMVSSNLLTEEIAGFNLKLPNNLYIIGTVNMDETTHPFSKKVLDRANTIELNDVDLGNFAFLNEHETEESMEIPHERLASNYLHLKDVFPKHKEVVEKATSELVKINEALQKMHAHVGYRVRDEICFYLAYNEEAELFTFNEAFDYCVLQKVLPRIAGSDSRVEKMLRELYTIFTNKAYDDGQEDIAADLTSSKYPRSAMKVAEMLRRFEEDGFTSFWVS